ncbi:MAG: hypothetical protein ACM3JD_07550 [Rudaea sp.]
MSGKKDPGSGDHISVGDISNSSGIAIGRGASARVTQGVDPEKLAMLFSAVYRQIDARPAMPAERKTQVAETVKKIEAEAAKGKAADPSKVEDALRKLAKMAPDILEVTAATLLNPVAGVASAIRKIAQRIKAQAEK